MTAAPDLSAPCRVILVRHGRTDHTAADLISGAGSQPEPALDQEGRAQARAVAEHLVALGERVDLVLASPMLRALQTAQLITERMPLPVAAPRPAWAEAHFGAWEGLAVAEVMERYPGGWEAMIGDPGIGPPQGETLTQVRARVLRAWSDVGSPGATTLIVTHLTPIRIVVAEVLGLSHLAFGRVLAAPGSVTIVDRWTDGGAVLLTLGERPRR